MGIGEKCFDAQRHQGMARIVCLLTSEHSDIETESRCSFGSVRRINFRRDPIHEWDKNKPPMSWPIPVQVFAVQLRAMYIGMVELSSSTSSLSDEGEELSDGDGLPSDSDEGEFEV